MHSFHQPYDANITAETIFIDSLLATMVVTIDALFGSMLMTRSALVATDAGIAKHAAQVHAACNESSRAIVEHPNYAIRFRSSNAIWAPAGLNHSVK